RSGDSGPHRAEDLVTGPHPDRHPRHGPGDVVEIDRLVRAVQSPERAARLQLPQVAFGHLPPEDGLLTRLVRRVLVAGEGERPGAQVLDVTGASSRAAIALASVNRSPPRVSPSVWARSSTASRDRSSSATWIHDAPLVRPNSTTPVCSAAARTSSSTSTGTRTTSPAAPAAPSSRSSAAVGPAPLTPTPSTSAPAPDTGGSSGSWMTTPSTERSGSTEPAATSSSVDPRSSRTRPRVARGR